jgi:hypothetical protein
MLSKKFLNELPVIGLGTGFAISGISATVIGIHGVKKNPYYAGVLMAGGTWFAHVGSQIAIGAVERIRGLQ